MTGTDHTQLKAETQGPVVILTNPQMGENIGAAARAMLNCGVSSLRIVNPRDGWPNERADAMSAGALAAMPPVEVFSSTAAAIADLHFVYATTARPRDMVKQVMTARSAAADMRHREAEGQRIGLLFGAERSEGQSAGNGDGVRSIHLAAPPSHSHRSWKRVSTVGCIPPNSTTDPRRLS